MSDPERSRLLTEGVDTHPAPDWVADELDRVEAEDGGVGAESP